MTYLTSHFVLTGTRGRSPSDRSQQSRNRGRRSVDMISYDNTTDGSTYHADLESVVTPDGAYKSKKLADIRVTDS